MLDPFSVAALIRAATRDDASIPRLPRNETRIASAWTVTVQASVFLAVVVLPLILILGWWTAPATAAVVAGLMATMRQSRCFYQRFRLS
ncbi:hypothetical protein GCM10022403_034980 [Streptomyces coacervatus]|uniref:Uncharacterized protein n=1 Tax=Streptomyces coacervatus TaxID=647381 RepID=A0ABP7HN97_9ACTN|nr:hypothetical protein [Streptomyces coacervatus]MDF2272031.1 hypothetical protein [Streptomyces coacervatus]